VVALGLITDRAIADAEVTERVLELIEVHEHGASRARFVPLADGIEDWLVQLEDELRRI